MVDNKGVLCFALFFLRIFQSKVLVPSWSESGLNRQQVVVIKESWDLGGGLNGSLGMMRGSESFRGKPFWQTVVHAQ